MKRMISVAACLLAAACCSSESNESKLAELKARPTATTVAGAEAAYNEIAEFVDDLDEDEEPAVLERAHALQEQRAVEFKNAVLKHRAVGSTWKVLKALYESGAPVVKFNDWNWGLGDKKLQSSAPEESLKGVNPTRDTPASELQKGDKK